MSKAATLFLKKVGFHPEADKSLNYISFDVLSPTWGDFPRQPYYQKENVMLVPKRRLYFANTFI